MRLFIIALLFAISYAQTDLQCDIDFDSLTPPSIDHTGKQYVLARGTWTSQRVANFMAAVFLRGILEFNITFLDTKYYQNWNSKDDYMHLADGRVDLNFEMWNNSPTTEHIKLINQIPYREPNGVVATETFYTPNYVIEDFPQLAESLSAIMEYPELLQKLIDDNPIPSSANFSILYGNPAYTVARKGPEIISNFSLPAVMANFTNDTELLQHVGDYLKEGRYFIFYWFEPESDFGGQISKIKIPFHQYYPDERLLLKFGSSDALDNSDLMKYVNAMNFTTKELNQAAEHYIDCVLYSKKDNDMCSIEAACSIMQQDDGKIIKRWIELANTQSADFSEELKQWNVIVICLGVILFYYLSIYVCLCKASIFLHTKRKPEANPRNIYDETPAILVGRGYKGLLWHQKGIISTLFPKNPKRKNALDVSGWSLFKLWIFHLPLLAKAKIFFRFTDILFGLMFLRHLYDKYEDLAYFGAFCLIIGIGAWFLMMYLNMALFSHHPDNSREKYILNLRWDVLVLTPVDDIVMVVLTSYCFFEGTRNLWGFMALAASSIQIVTVHGLRAILEKRGLVPRSSKRIKSKYNTKSKLPGPTPSPMPSNIYFESDIEAITPSITPNIASADITPTIMTEYTYSQNLKPCIPTEDDDVFEYEKEVEDVVDAAFPMSYTFHLDTPHLDDPHMEIILQESESFRL